MEAESYWMAGWRPHSGGGGWCAFEGLGFAGSPCCQARIPPSLLTREASHTVVFVSELHCTASNGRSVSS